VQFQSFLKISKLDDEIKAVAGKFKDWTMAKLLQLAKIKDNDKRVGKFLEFKKIINKKLGKETAVNTTSSIPKGEESKLKETSSLKNKSFKVIDKYLMFVLKYLKKDRS
jgi:hypothetical protein